MKLDARGERPVEHGRFVNEPVDHRQHRFLGEEAVRDERVKPPEIFEMDALAADFANGAF